MTVLTHAVLGVSYFLVFALVQCNQAYFNGKAL